MGLITGLFTLPLAPVKGVIWVAQRIDEQARREHCDPGQVILQLEELADARDAGLISMADADLAEAALIARLTSGPGYRSLTHPADAARVEPEPEQRA